MNEITRYGLRLQKFEKTLLEELAQIEGGISQADVIRRLIRKAANEQGLVWKILPKGNRKSGTILQGETK